MRSLSTLLSSGLVRKKLLAMFAMLAPVLISACDSADIGKVLSASDTPLQTTRDIPIVAAQPDVSFDGQAVTLTAHESPLLQRLAIVDSGAESAVSAGPIPQADPRFGFAYSGDCRYSDERVAAANGRWRFELGAACEMVQLSNTNLQTGDGITLIVDVLLNGEAELTTQIVLEQDNGALIELASRRISQADTGVGWKTVQVSVLFSTADDYSGGRIGLRLINANAGSFASVDAIELSVHKPGTSDVGVFANSWSDHCDQLWAGKHFWANRLQDWEVYQGRLRTRDASEYRPNRTTHRITTQVTAAPSDFTLKVDTGVTGVNHPGAYSGFLLGAGARMDYRSAALVHNRHGKNGGLIAGIDSDGRVFVMDHGVSKGRLVSGPPATGISDEGVTLQLDAKMQSSGTYKLSLFSLQSSGQILSSTQVEVEPEALLGNIALVSNSGSRATTHWFDNWQGYGSKLHEVPSRQFGPVLFSSYTLSRGVLTINAQYPPVCTDSLLNPELQINIDGEWNTIASASIDDESFTARFEVESWTYQLAVRYRIVTNLPIQGAEQAHYFEGAVQPDIADKEDFVLGVFNCRPGLIASNVEGWIQQNNNAPFSWTRERIVFPHEELLLNSQLHPLSMVAFLGDQIYEFDPNGLIEKRPEFIINDYLWKWYQFGWSAREIMRNLPAIILPDDHDVYQANIWGQEGIVAEKPEDGGYVYPASFVNVVQKTQTGSLPRPHSGRMLNQGIGTYYTSLVYGGVGMAILEDRKFKTGPNSSTRPQQLLGAEQHTFLEQWAADWQGHTMKLAVSQSPFSQSTTHSGPNFTLNKRDLDSNGWPRQGRDEAVHLLRKAFAPHVAGDQHLGMSLKHGIETPGDAVYSFAGPSMLNIFPRIWDPANTEDGPGNRASEYRGQHTDAHGNLIDVLAVANPDVYYKPVEANSVPSKNELGIGYGIVRVNKAQRQYTFEAWPADVSPRVAVSGHYPDWPITVDQTENDGRIPAGYLSSRQAGVPEPVVQVFNEADGALVYARRLTTATVQLPVYDATGLYTVVLSDPDTGYREEFQGQSAQ